MDHNGKATRKFEYDSSLSGQSKLPDPRVKRFEVCAAVRRRKLRSCSLQVLESESPESPVTCM